MTYLCPMVIILFNSNQLVVWCWFFRVHCLEVHGNSLVRPFQKTIYSKLTLTLIPLPLAMTLHCLGLWIKISSSIFNQIHCSLIAHAPLEISLFTHLKDLRKDEMQYFQYWMYSNEHSNHKNAEISSKPKFPPVHFCISQFWQIN